MSRWQTVATFVVRGVGVLGFEDSADRLLLEPRPRVALVHASGDGELCRRRAGGLGERPVRAKAIANLHAEEIQRADFARRQLADEGVPSRCG